MVAGQPEAPEAISVCGRERICSLPRQVRGPKRAARTSPPPVREANAVWPYRTSRLGEGGRRLAPLPPAPLPPAPVAPGPLPLEPEPEPFEPPLPEGSPTGLPPPVVVWPGVEGTASVAGAPTFPARSTACKEKVWAPPGSVMVTVVVWANVPGAPSPIVAGSTAIPSTEAW